MLNRYRSLDNNHFCGGYGLHIGDPETGLAPASFSPRSCATPSSAALWGSSNGGDLPLDPWIFLPWTAPAPMLRATMDPCPWSRAPDSTFPLRGSPFGRTKHLALRSPVLCTCPCYQLCHDGSSDLETSSDFGPTNARIRSPSPLPRCLFLVFRDTADLNFPLSRAIVFRPFRPTLQLCCAAAAWDK